MGSHSRRPHSTGPPLKGARMKPLSGRPLVGVCLCPFRYCHVFGVAMWSSTTIFGSAFFICMRVMCDLRTSWKGCRPGVTSCLARSTQMAANTPKESSNLANLQISQTFSYLFECGVVLGQRDFASLSPLASPSPLAFLLIRLHVSWAHSDSSHWRH
jgi:hypothetical protein